MTQTFFFYDLETSGLSGRDDRIMQFAGIRTDENLKQIGEPVNVLVKLSDDILPSPDALMVTGITPQKTVEEGYGEAEFAKLISNEVFTPDTVVIGFNNIRFDDEFIRHLFWRNFFDPYEWSWKDGRSRWDLLDVVRMTRALRPDGINWPVDDKGQPTNRLELLSASNKLSHKKAHDALSDVEALIEITRLIRDKQPQLYDYMFKLRDKKEIKKLVNLDDKKPFVYVSGRLDSAFNKATVAFPLTSGKNGNVVVYDLRYDPTPFIDMDVKALNKLMYASREERKAEDFLKLPVKEMQYNHAPAIAPLNVLEQQDGWKKLGLSKGIIDKHQKILLSTPGFAENIRTLYESKPDYKPSNDPDSQLYDSFVPDIDKLRIDAVRNSTAEQLADFNPNFVDERLAPLLLRYKARNFPRSLSENEATQWEKLRSVKIMNALPTFMKSLQKLVALDLSDEKKFVLQELQLWAESVMPSDIDSQE